MTVLRCETFLARREGPTRDLVPGDNEDLRWVTNSATLIFGDQDAVLVDTFTTIEQTRVLVQWVKGEGPWPAAHPHHGHGDHVYGIGQLLRTFPDARAVATPGTLAEARLQAQDEYRVDFWGRLFPGQIPPPVHPELPHGNLFGLEGHNLRVVEAGHTDTQRYNGALGARHPLGRQR
jgi:glyoxylase-like metal-dependent hydrolase (beta-lactamase superfamily II)